MEKCNTELLYRVHRERLLNLIQAKVEDSQKAEDLLHDSFVKLQQCCDKDCECERPKSFLFKVVMNTVFDYFKKRKKRRTRIPSSIIERDDIQMENEPSCDLLECIQTLLSEISLENRIAFEQVDLHQQSQVKVAEALNIPLPTLKSRVQRTRKYLKNRIEACCPDYKSKCI